MRDEVYQKVVERLLSEFSSMGGGAVGGVSTPLGSGPKAGAKGENIYKKSTANDKEHRSKGKKKKTYTRSIQWYLKNGGEKGRKRSFKEALMHYSGLTVNEVRTARIKDFSKEEIVSFLRYLKNDLNDNISFSSTEKIAGQSMTIGIRGTSKGNAIYCGTKDAVIEMGGNIFNRRFYKSSATSRLVKNAFIKKFRRLQPDEEIVLGMEIVINDYSKPDYIAYEIPREKQVAAIFSITPVGAFTKKDAQNISGKYWNRRYRSNSILEVLMPEDIPLNPTIDLDQAIVTEIDELITLTINSPSSRNKGEEYPVKSYIEKNISPRIRSLVKTIFPSSNINSRSPIEGIAVNMTSNGQNTFFKVPNQDFDELQSIQAAVYAEFKTNSHLDNISRAQGFIAQLENPQKKQSFARNIFKLVKYLSSKSTLPLNYRTFFSPGKFDLFCQELYNGLLNKDIEKISSALYIISTRLYTSKGNESFTSTNSEQLAQFIEQNNLI
jgi:hypothetical protein